MFILAVVATPIGEEKVGDALNDEGDSKVVVVSEGVKGTEMKGLGISAGKSERLLSFLRRLIKSFTE